MGKTLVLGATGRLAGLTAKKLHEAAPGSLRIATSRETRLPRLRDRFPGAEAIVADWNDKINLAAAMQGISRLLVVTPDLITDESTVTPNIIRAARRVGTIELLVRFLGMPPGLTAQDLTQEFLDTRCGANLHAVAKPLLDVSGLPVCYVNVPGWIMFNMASFFFPQVKANRRIAMPAASDERRMWVSEHDIAAVIARVLSELPADHVGQEHALTSSERHAYADVARLFADVLGEPVVCVDDDKPLRALMGEEFDRLMTYFRHETHAYGNVSHTQTLSRLLGRSPQTLSDYIEASRHKFQ